MSETWLFMGNPGTGKSTLFNCLASFAAFRSGMSYGGGLTRSTQAVTDANGIVYMDTPGLADLTAEQFAAEAITRALRSGNGRFKLCFFVRLESGRVVSEDLVTMERVLDSLRVPNVPFGIIINNINASSYSRLAAQQWEFQRVVTLLNSGKYSTPHLLFIPKFTPLVEADDCIIDLPRDIRASIEQFPTVVIPRAAVDNIWTPSFAVAAEQTKFKLEAIQTNERELQVVRHDLGRRHTNFWAVAMTALDAIGQIAEFANNLLA